VERNAGEEANVSAGRNPGKGALTKKAGAMGPGRFILLLFRGADQPFAAAATSAAKSLVCFSMPSPSA
jgi:hypothetical protein